jgi:hypothetical protein
MSHGQLTLLIWLAFIAVCAVASAWERRGRR